MTRCLRPISLFVGISVLSLLPFGCSRDGDDEPGTGQPPSAGTSGMGSTSLNRGGSTASGGSTGKGSGGRAESGGSSSSAQGGTVSQGGTAAPSSGGSKAGSSSGGSGFGGASTAGNTNSGGRSQTGGSANGGRASGGRSSSGGAPMGGNSSGGTSSGGAASGGTSSSTGCDQPGLVWKTANKTNYTSYPEPGSEECVDFSGCEYEGLFSACDEKRSQDWVKTHNIAAVFPHMSTLALHDLCIKSGSKTMVVTVIDECADSDCEGCCTENRGDADELIDLESFTNERFGVEDGPIMWADLGPTRGKGCE